MSTFLQVVPQQSEHASASSIRISKSSSTRTQQEFEKYKQSLLSNPGQTLYDYCILNGLSYNVLRAYASNHHINIRSLRKESLSRSANDTSNSTITDFPGKVQAQQIRVVVKIRDISFDITGINADDISAIIERMTDHV